jgi:hypothetical protein
MSDFGGLGGYAGGISLEDCSGDLFVAALNRACGEQIRNGSGAEVWSALANVDWKHENGDTAGYSFRAAGDLIAAIKGSGDYMDWYCSGPYATVADWIEEAMAKEGWTHNAA